MRVACVTGSASGIGAAVKASFESSGCRVIGVDLHDADVVADLATPEGRRAAIDGVMQASGGVVDALVPCAGVGGSSSGEATVRLNYFGTMAIVDGLRGALAAGTDSTLVMISSNSTTMTPGLSVVDADVYLAGDEEAAVAHFGRAGWMAYPAGKLAIAYWVRSAAPQWITDGIRVNAVAPGVTDTNMTRPLLDVKGVSEALAAIPIPIGRWGTADEIASVVHFLSSPASRIIVGQVVFADGGTDAVVQPRGHPVPLI